jgi:hypothetical protein
VAVLSSITEREVREVTRSFFLEHRGQSLSFEKVARLIVTHLYHTFQDEAGQPAFALLRIFRLCQHGQLPPGVRVASGDGQERWLALAATIGVEAAWQDRRLSVGHQAIPAGSSLSPMLRAAFEQLRFNPNLPVSAPSALKMEEGNTLTDRYFHIEKAPGSPFIPAQDFVAQYGIQSVIGLGSEFISGSFYLLVGFSRLPVTVDDARKFVEMSPFISTLLALSDSSGSLWDA